MRVISLFAGIGGFDLGFERAGHEVVAQVESDKRCRQLLAAKWPGRVLGDDVRVAGSAETLLSRALAAREILISDYYTTRITRRHRKPYPTARDALRWARKNTLPECDLITFGFPCQDLSVAGRRAGLKGERSGLFHEAVRIINELRPQYCLWENVPGLLSSNKGRDFAEVLNTLAQHGYYGAWRVLDSQWFGVAQRRRRCFGLFTRHDSGAERCAEILSISESLRGHPAPSRPTGQGVTHDVAPSIRGSGAGTARCGESRGQDCVIPSPDVAGCLQERDAKGSDSDTKPGHLIATPWDSQRARIHDPDGVAPTLQCGAETSGDITPAICFLPGQSAQSRSLGETENCSVTIGACAGGNKPHVAGTFGVRRLTPVECERLQGFPDNWTGAFSDTTRYRMLGNAVTVNVAEWIAGRMTI